MPLFAEEKERWDSVPAGELLSTRASVRNAVAQKKQSLLESEKQGSHPQNHRIPTTKGGGHVSSHINPNAALSLEHGDL